MIKYFIEHKKTQTWLTVNGELTNNPNHEFILSSKDKFNMDNWLLPMEVAFDSDYSGKFFMENEESDMIVVLQHDIIGKLKSNNIFLFEDFIITEHEFINCSCKEDECCSKC